VADLLDDSFSVVALGDRSIAGIMMPMPVYRLRTSAELADDIPVSLTE
jgi:hypothetical protein